MRLRNVLLVSAIVAVAVLLLFGDDLPFFGGEARTFSLWRFFRSNKSSPHPMSANSPTQTSAESSDYTAKMHRDIVATPDAHRALVPTSWEVPPRVFELKFAGPNETRLTPDSAANVTAVGREAATIVGRSFTVTIHGPIASSFERKRIEHVKELLELAGAPPWSIRVDGVDESAAPVYLMLWPGRDADIRFRSERAKAARE